MAHKDFLAFLLAVRESPLMLVRYDRRNLAQLLFHARNEGYDFTADEVADLVGALEASVILDKDGDQFDGSSRLWQQMWGRRHLAYVIDCVVRRHTDAELAELTDRAAAAGVPS
jgi:hypothetical protein